MTTTNSNVKRFDNVDLGRKSSLITVSFHHRAFGFITGFRGDNGKLYFKLSDVVRIFGISNLKPFEDYIVSGSMIDREDLGPFIIEEGVNRIWRLYEPWFTSHTCEAHRWIEEKVVPVLRGMRSSKPTKTKTPNTQPVLNTVSVFATLWSVVTLITTILH